ncbi:MAG: hypothetical protein NC313_15795 [Butyrivibrio sp.]|nr:hypothetical protein [Butyrivibrio sp.]
MLFIEIQCKKWEHTRINVGMIELCNSVLPDEKIKVYAEQAHIEELRALTANEDIEIIANAVEFEDWRFDSLAHSDKYIELLTGIIQKEAEEKKIILLSCNIGIIRAVAYVSVKYNDRVFYVALHAALEEAAHEYHANIKNGSYAFWQKVKNALTGRKPESRREMSVQECINECISCNCHFIVYAPGYREYLSGKIDREILNRFIFLHHPLYNPNDYSAPSNDRLTIGVYGGGVNQNAYNIINIYNEKYDNGKVLFRVMAEQDNPILCLKNVTRMFEQDYVSNEELEQERKRLDYVLLPYDHNQYMVTASGILSDALSEEIPVLMLDSPFLQYYNNYTIGELLCDVDSMARYIAETASDKVERDKLIEKCRHAEHELKRRILSDNIKTFGEMIG